jgi:hypothetical protein
VEESLLEITGCRNDYVTDQVDKAQYSDVWINEKLEFKGARHDEVRKLEGSVLRADA